MGTRSRSWSPQASTRRPTTLRAMMPMIRMMPAAVRNPSPGAGRPSIFSYIGPKTSSIRLQKIHRSHAVRKTGTVTKKPAMKRTLSQLRMVSPRIASRATGARRVRRRALVTLCRARRGAEAAWILRGALAKGDPRSRRLRRRRGRRGPLLRHLSALHHGPGAEGGRRRGRDELRRRGLRAGDPAAAHRAQEVAQRREAHEWITALLVTDGRRRAAVVVTREQDRGVRQRAESLRERLVHLGRIAARQVGAPARADEERVPRHEPAIDQKTLGARRVPGGVHERQRQASDRQSRVVVDRYQVRAEAPEELALGLVHVDLQLHAPQELLDTGYAPGHAPRGEAPADVVLVRVRDQRARDRHAPRLGGLDDRVDLPGRIDDDALARYRVANEIDEILHRPELHLLEIDRVVRHVHHPTPVAPPGE